MLSIQRKKDTRVVHAYTHNLADLPDGIGVATSELVPGTPLLEGTAIGIDSSNLAHVIKCAKIYEAADNTATAYKVAKGSHFKAGDFVATETGATSKTISSIDKTNAAYDVITVDATLGKAVTTSDVLVGVAAAASSSALKYAPVALIADSYDVFANDNLFVAAITIGQFKEANIPALNASVKAALKNIVLI